MTTHCITKTQSYSILKALNRKILIEWKIMAWDGMECKWNGNGIEYHQMDWKIDQNRPQISLDQLCLSSMKATKNSLENSD